MNWKLKALAVLAALSFMPGCEEKPGTNEKSWSDRLNTQAERFITENDEREDRLYGPPHEPMPGAQPEIVVRSTASDTSIAYNGQPLVLGASVKSWTDVLPAPSRQGTTYLIWDDLGLELHGSPARDDMQVLLDGLETDRLVVRLAPHPPDPSSAEPWESEPSARHAFPGYLKINGIGVDGQSNIPGMNRLGRKAEFETHYRCRSASLRDCNATSDHAINISLYLVDADPANSTIDTVIFSLP